MASREAAKEANSSCWKGELCVPAQTEELARVNDFIHEGLDQVDCPVSAQNQLDIAVEELFVNVCRYAYAAAPAGVKRTVHVSCAFTANPPSATVNILDDGMPFDPLGKPDAASVDSFDSIADVPVGGLGILMAKQSVDEISYKRTGGSNVVTINKQW